MARQRVHALVRCYVELKSVICLSDDAAHALIVQAWAASSLKHLQALNPAKFPESCARADDP